MVSEADPAARGSFLQNAFTRVPAAIAAIGLDGRVLECNPAYGELVGIPAGDLIGADALAHVHPDDVEQAISSSVDRMEGTRTSDNRPQPIRIRRSDGTFVWVQFDSSLIDDAPEPYVLATMTDVSAQVLADAAHARSEEWYRSLALHQSDIVTVVGFDGTVLYISPNCERLLDFTDTELVGSSGIDNIHPDDIEALMVGISKQLDADADAHPFEYRQRCRDGSWLWLEATARELPAAFGVEAVIVNARDVSERRRAAAAARAAEDRFRVAFATSPLGIGFARLDGRLTWVNRALAEIVGVPQDQMVTMSFQDFSTGDEFAWEQHETLRLMAGTIDSFRVDKEYQHPDGRVVWARLHVSLMRDADGAPEQLLGQLEDITERKQLEMSLTHDALHDSLTGLLNRSGLRTAVDVAWAVRSRQQPMAILFGDLDGFKLVNDTLGHDAGDEVLVRVAERLRGAVRADDVVARWGGDEFVVLCPSVDNVDDATAIADRIRVALEAPFNLGPGPAHIGISIGVALDDGQPLPDLVVKDADAAAYQAKGSGRNRIVVANA